VLSLSIVFVRCYLLSIWNSEMIIVSLGSIWIIRMMMMNVCWFRNVNWVIVSVVSSLKSSAIVIVVIVMDRFICRVLRNGNCLLDSILW